MLADSTPLGLDSSWWTAIATILALVLGLLGIIGPSISRWFWKPKLNLEARKVIDHSDLHDDVFHLRLPVSNAKGKNPAADVEVFLEYIQMDHATDPVELPRYLPIRLTWAHGGGAICPRIAGGAYRLLDLGVISFTVNSETDFITAFSAYVDNINPISLCFNAEVAANSTKLGVPSGAYTLGFLIASNSSVCRQKIRIVLKRREIDASLPLSSYLEIYN